MWLIPVWFLPRCTAAFSPVKGFMGKHHPNRAGYSQIRWPPTSKSIKKKNVFCIRAFKTFSNAATLCRVPPCVYLTQQFLYLFFLSFRSSLIFSFPTDPCTNTSLHTFILHSSLYHNAASWGLYLYSCHTAENLKRTVATKESTNQRTSQFLGEWRPILPHIVFLFLYYFVCAPSDFCDWNKPGKVNLTVTRMAKALNQHASYSWGLLINPPPPTSPPLLFYFLASVQTDGSEKIHFTQSL